MSGINAFPSDSSDELPEWEPGDFGPEALLFSKFGVTPPRSTPTRAMCPICYGKGWVSVLPPSPSSRSTHK